MIIIMINDKQNKENINKEKENRIKINKSQASISMLVKSSHNWNGPSLN